MKVIFRCALELLASMSVGDTVVILKLTGLDFTDSVTKLIHNYMNYTSDQCFGNIKED